MLSRMFSIRLRRAGKPSVNSCRASGAPMQKYPQRVDYGGGQINMTWMCDHTMEDRQMIELWQSSIYDEMFQMNYREDYEGTCKITQLGQDNIPIYSAKDFE